MKKIFLAAAVVAMSIVGCTNDEQSATLQQGNVGKAAMIKVDLKSASTKGTNGGFELGSADENKVSTVDFYFYDAAGAAYSVTNSGNAISWTAGSVGDNIEKISDAILVIKQSEVAPPSKVVAIINSTVDYKNVNLANLGSQVINALHTNNSDFVMSNSVYFDEDNKVEVVASTIAQENIFTTNDEDLEGIKEGDVIPADKVNSLEIEPIEIYVERVAAKVRVGAATGVNMNLIPVMNAEGTTQMVDADGNDVYVKILGWDVTNNTDEAYLVKGIDGTWTSAASSVGFAWNNQGNFRSYWAQTTDVPQHNLTFNNLIGANLAKGYNYYFENTKPYAQFNSVDSLDATGNKASQLLVAAQLVDANGDTIRLAKWYGVNYTIADLKVAMINTIASKVYVLDEDNSTAENKVYKSVSVNDVVFYQTAATAEDNRYEVLVKAKDNVKYYNAKGEELTTAAATIAAIDPAQMWYEGYTYYYTTIEHLGAAGSLGQYGIVRNHIYDITIDGVKGFGTPVYDPTMVIIPEPVDPQDALNLAARINILSWQLVKQNVTLQ